MGIPFVLRALPTPPVQLVTGAWRDDADLRARVEAALRGGIRWVQLRAKERSTRELHLAALLVAPILRDAGALFVVNDRADVAQAVGAGGVHLPENGMSALDARRQLGADAWVARSIHSARAVGSDASLEADALQLGPVFDTASKREFGAPLGLAVLRDAAEAASGVPIIAVGGVSAASAARCREAGARAVAVIGSVWDAADVESAARKLIASLGLS